MLTQMQHFELARRRMADADHTFMELVNHPTNPITREDLAANIRRRPALWSRYAGFLDKLPSQDAQAALQPASVVDFFKAQTHA